MSSTEDNGAGQGVEGFESMLGQIPLEISVELGRTSLPLRELLGKLASGAVITLDKLAGEKLDVYVNDRLVAKGEAVAVGERYGLKILELIGPRGEKGQ